MGEIRNSYKILVRKSEGKKPLGKPRSRREDNIRIELGEIGWRDFDWIHVTQDRVQWRDLVNMIMKLPTS
jgi:hypothetical protein